MPVSDKIHGWIRERIFLYGTREEKRLWHAYARARNKRSEKIREILARRLDGSVSAEESKSDPFSAHRQVMEEKGYVILRPGRFPLIGEAVEEARANFRHHASGPNKRDHDNLEAATRRIRGYSTAINRLAMHPLVLRFISVYLGLLPVLYRINLIFSPNQEDVPLSSQRWHFDPEDVRQVKMFVAVEDTDEESGPTHVVPASLSEKVRRKVRFRNQRITDESLFKMIPEDSPVPFTGKSGTLLFCDTSRCLHMGGRKAAKQRYQIVVQYLMPYAVSFPAHGPLGKTPVGIQAIPPQPSRFDRYLLGVVR